MFEQTGARAGVLSIATVPQGPEGMEQATPTAEQVTPTAEQATPTAEQQA